MSEMGVGLSDLPDGWVWTTLEEVSELNPRIDKQSIDDDLEVTFLPMKRVEALSGKIDLSETKRFSELKRKSYTPFQDGDILFAKVTPCMENGKIAIAYDLKNGIGFGSTEFHVIRLSEEQSRQFFFFCFLQQKFRQEAKRAMTSAVGLLRVPADYMRRVLLPLPPLPEQHRIVAKIEELFTKLDAGINELHKAQAQLKRYRQSVLKAAFEGKLTEAWRAMHQEEIEPASILLERILKERREKWEAEQLEQMKAKGKMPKDDKWKMKYKEPVAPDTSNLPELPDGWGWVKLGQVTDLITKGSSPRWQGFNYVDKGLLFLRSQNVGWGGLNLSNIAYLPEAFNKKERKSVLETGDVLLNLVGASIGRAAIASDELEGANMNQAVALIRLVKDGLDNKFLMNYLISPDAQSTIHGKKVDVARANLSLTDVSEFAVPLPPLPEQQAIVSEVESRLSVTDEVEKTVTAELKRAEQLRQSILKQAFSGKLVPQDPNDEPASILLEQIKAKKSQHAQGQLRLKLA